MGQILTMPRRKIASLRPVPGEAQAGADDNPRRGIGPCLAYLAVEFGRPMAWFPFLEPLRLGLFVAVWGFLAVVRRRARSLPRIFWALFGFAAVMAANVPFAMNNRWALWGLQDFTILIVGFVLPLAILPPTVASVHYLAQAYFFLHVPMAIHAIFYGGRGMSGWMGDENDLALALNMAMGVGIYLFLEARGTKKMLVLASIGVMIAGVVASLSRGGFVGLASLALFVLLTGPHRIRVLFCLVLAVVGLFAFAPDHYWDEVRSIQTAGDPGDTGEQRMYLWGMAWRMYLDHPMIGVGPRNYGIQAPYYEDTLRADLGGYHTWGKVCHSLYFTLISELGTLGTIFFLVVVFWFARSALRVRRLRTQGEKGRTAALVATGLLSSAFAYLVTGAFLSVLYYPLLWVLVGMLAALEATARDEVPAT